ncbi:hypothetical protein PF008_g18403 [Phytophthora fragariae]|uniref:Uncharacterized protein n=1 Tax=Phytophthora fragariae TaxID=53985 RepID=A0A6G0R5F8_9STRA|nr:hypothetical protein PF008_g18403 [Phytophthora fragariae]
MLVEFIFQYVGAFAGNISAYLFGACCLDFAREMFTREE